MTEALVSCQGASRSIRLVSVEGPLVGLLGAPFQSTALRQCLKLETGQPEQPGLPGLGVEEVAKDIRKSII